MNTDVQAAMPSTVTAWSLRSLSAGVAIALTLSTVQAHSLSTSYAKIPIQGQPTIQLQLALNDLQLALQWSTQRDLTWSMVKTQFPQILAHLQQQLVLHNDQRQPLACVWQSDTSAWKLAQIQQQYYLQLPLTSDCPKASWLHYQLFMQLHDHKALINTPLGESILDEATPWLAL